MKKISFILGFIFFHLFVVGCSENETELTNNIKDENITNLIDSIQYVISDDYVEGFSSILLSDGRFILIQPDSLDGFYFLFDSINSETGMPFEDLGLCAYCDSMMRPILVKIGNKQFNFIYNSSNSFDLEELSNDSIIIHKNILYSPYSISYSKTKSSTDNSILDVIGNVLSVINPVAGFVKEGEAGLCKSLLQEIINNLVIPGDLLSGTATAAFSAFEIATTTGGVAALGVSNWAIGTLLAMRGASQYIIKGIMGNVTPTILDVTLSRDNIVEVYLNVEGVDRASKEWPNYSILYWKQGSNTIKRTTPERITENGYILGRIEGINSGRWGFKVIVFPERFYNHPLLANYYSFDTKTLYRTFAPIEIKSVDKSWENTDSDPIQFQYKVIVDYLSREDKAVINYNDGYGVCLTQDGKKNYYSSTDNVGTGSSELYLIPLNISKSKFMEDSNNKDIMIYNDEDIFFQTYFHMDGYIQYGVPYIIHPSYEISSFLTCPDNNHPHMIDLGLSVKWACCNVGAMTPEAYGDYYAWGEVSVKDSYSCNNYKYWSSYLNQTKYNFDSRFGSVDNKTCLDPEDDVAHVKWGGNWRMPTKSEMKELIDSCKFTNITLNGINGNLFTSTVSGFTNRSIFLPFGGYRDNCPDSIWRYSSDIIDSYLSPMRSNKSNFSIIENVGDGVLNSSSILNSTQINVSNTGTNRSTNNNYFYVGSSGHYWTSTIGWMPNKGSCLDVYSYYNYYLGMGMMRYAGAPVRPVIP